MIFTLEDIVLAWSDYNEADRSPGTFPAYLIKRKEEKESFKEMGGILKVNPNKIMGTIRNEERFCNATPTTER